MGGGEEVGGEGGGRQEGVMICVCRRRRGTQGKVHSFSSTFEMAHHLHILPPVRHSSLP